MTELKPNIPEEETPEIPHLERHLSTSNLLIAIIVCIWWVIWFLQWNNISKLLWIGWNKLRATYECEEIIKNTWDRVICVVKWGKWPTQQIKVWNTYITSYQKWWEDNVIVIRNGKIIFRWTRWDLAAQNTKCGTMNFIDFKSMWNQKYREKVDECITNL